MRLNVYILILSILLPVKLMAAGPAAEDAAAREARLRKELAPRPYTFDQYMADLKDSARKDAPKPDNPVTEEQTKVAANKYKNYKPLNPFVVEWGAGRR